MININDYNYDLPSDLIARAPTDKRDGSKLFVYNTQTDTIVFDHFCNLDRYLPVNSFLVLNNTKVLPSRITMYKKTEGKVKVLFLVNEMSDDDVKVKAFIDRRVEVGDDLKFENGSWMRVVEQNGAIFVLKLANGMSKMDLFKILEIQGSMPIPLYIKNTPLSEQQLKERYQTIFAKIYGSVAAPTASLHFTEKVFNKLHNKGIEKAFVTLHVGMGTFAPIDERNLQKKKLHEEFYEINESDKSKIEKWKNKGQKLVSVGTTVTRALESISNIRNTKYEIRNTVGQTDLFIFPRYAFKAVDILITNFHLPKSSLMMLVDTFLIHKGAKKNIVDLYKRAIKEKFYFYSFGDSMLVI